MNSAFNGKRKMLRKSLQHISPSPDTEAALREIGLPATVSTHSVYIYIYRDCIDDCLISYQPYAVKARGAVFGRLCKTSQLDSENIETG